MNEQEWYDQVEESLKKRGIQYREEQIQKSAVFLKQVWEANRRLNLTGACNESELLEKHFLDSLSLLEFYDLGKEKWCDLGSGAGFPGIPLKIFFPASELYILESSRKKINFIKRSLQFIEKRGVHLLHGRAENYGREEKWRGKFKFITCRAVAGLRVLVELGMPFLCEGGSMYLYKGPQLEKEIEQAGNALQLCNGKIVEQKEYRLSNGEIRKIINIKKKGPTPERYPRREGVPEKKPL